MSEELEKLQELYSDLSEANKRYSLSLFAQVGKMLKEMHDLKNCAEIQNLQEIQQKIDKIVEIVIQNIATFLVKYDKDIRELKKQHEEMQQKLQNFSKIFSGDNDNGRI